MSLQGIFGHDFPSRIYLSGTWCELFKKIGTSIVFQSGIVEDGIHFLFLLHGVPYVLFLIWKLKIGLKRCSIDHVLHDYQFMQRRSTNDGLDSAYVEKLAHSGEILRIGGK
jgi:hypothetical protein